MQGPTRRFSKGLVVTLAAIGIGLALFKSCHSKRMEKNINKLADKLFV